METYKVNQKGPQVQEALNKALTAYQKPDVGIPESDLSATLQQKIDGAYVKPNSGIPAMDLTENVQERLNNALERAFNLIGAVMTYNQETERYDLTSELIDIFQGCKTAWTHNRIPVLSLIKPAQGQLPAERWQTVQMLPQGEVAEPTRFVGSILYDATTIWFVYVSESECFAVSRTV